jgi:hypothetical protein
MKKIILGLIVVTLFGCSKTAPIIVTPIVITPITPTELPKIVYYGKTSYELKNTNKFINIDSLRNTFGIKNVGRWRGTNNYGFVYVDMNNDGREDIFYPYSSDGEFNTKPDVFINNGNSYTKDNSMLPTDYTGNQNTRKTIVGDFNNDSLPDLFLVNHGYEDNNYYPGETNTLLLSDKKTGKYKLGNLSMLNKAFWHGGASGDLNGDGNLDIIVLGGHPAKVLYGDGTGNFTATDWKYNAGNGYITGEIIDVDKDGQNDIILSGDEGRPAPARYSPSTIFWNTNNNFSKQTTIVAPSTNGWGTVMDIAVGDIDSDGINEIIFNRTGDINGNWYGGFQLNIYKTNDNYKTLNDVSNKFITNNISVQKPTTAWMYKINLYKVNNVYYLDGITTNSVVHRWKQDPITKIFN